MPKRVQPPHNTGTGHDVNTSRRCLRKHTLSCTRLLAAPFVDSSRIAPESHPQKTCLGRIFPIALAKESGKISAYGNALLTDHLMKGHDHGYASRRRLLRGVSASPRQKSAQIRTPRPMRQCLYWQSLKVGFPSAELNVRGRKTTPSANVVSTLPRSPMPTHVAHYVRIRLVRPVQSQSRGRRPCLDVETGIDAPGTVGGRISCPVCVGGCRPDNI